MPGPPPPPPPGGPPPMMPPTPAPFFSSGGGPDDRGALLQSIRKGAKLKKTVTVDKSAPVLGKVSSSSSSSSSGSAGGASPSFRGGGGGSVPNGLGGLFAGGMPKLKPTGKNLGGSTNTVSNSNNRTPESPSSKSVSTIQSELKKQMANDSRNMNRGPPPPAPVRSYNNGDDSSSRQPFGTKNGSSNGFHQNPSLPNLSSPLQLAPHPYHRKTNSSVSLHTVDSGSDISQNNNSKPVINHGKPNLAPKPPVLNGKPAAPPKRLIVNGKPVGRAQSMRSPRSPSPQSPDNNNPDFGTKFGTVRNLSQVLNQNLGQSLGNLSQVKNRPPLNGRPTAPPPSIPNTPPPPPPNKMVKPPNHAPPPPPNVIPQAPSHAPPPPPHRTGQQAPARPPPLTPNAPPPPPRHSSMRDVGNSRRPSSSSSSNTSSSSLEGRFHFHPATDFPRPMPFRGFPKLYNTTRQAGSKQQAPPPPTQIQLTNRLWESSTC